MRRRGPGRLRGYPGPRHTGGRTVADRRHDPRRGTDPRAAALGTQVPPEIPAAANRKCGEHPPKRPGVDQLSAETVSMRSACGTTTFEPVRNVRNACR